MRRVSLLLLLAFAAFTTTLVDAFLVLPSALARASRRQQSLRMQDSYLTSLEDSSSSSSSTATNSMAVGGGGGKEKKKVVVIGAGWGGLSAAYELAKRCV
jgi:chemotaxis response regulator CheB